MTTEAIIAHLQSVEKHDVAAVITTVKVKHKDTVLEQMEYWHRIGTVSEVEYQAYCYLWRNLVPRYSCNLAQYHIS